MKIALQKALEVYLDSSDFSTLSNPKTLTPEFCKILDQLKNFRNKGLVNFRFSSVHVSEVAPVLAKENLAAELRAELMWELCGNHAMVDYFRLMESEAKAEIICAFSDIGQWYPSINGLLPENVDLLQRNIVNEVLTEKGLNRAQRRFSKKAILNKKGFKPKIAELLDSSISERAKNLADIFR
jgi:hypothetical protein